MTSHFDIALWLAAAHGKVERTQKELRGIAYSTPRLGSNGTDTESAPPQHDTRIAAALRNISPALENTYIQVAHDIADPSRRSFGGVAHEIREILGTCLRELASDKEIKAQSWYKPEYNGETGKEQITQKQRAKYILKKRGAGSTEIDSSLEAVDTVEEAISSLVRATYARASDAAHRLKSRKEAEQLLRYFVALAHELLEMPQD